MNLRSILLACLAAAQARAEPVKIACFGDSVTEGTNSKGKPWCKEIRGVLGRNFFTTYNFGQSGATVTNVGTNSAPYIGSGKYADWRAAVTDSCEDKDCCEAGCARSPFQVGIISLGTNDAKTANLAAYNEATFRAQYQSLITNIVQDLYDPDDGGDCPGGGSDLQLLVLASAVPIAGPPISQTNDGAWDGDSALWVADTLPRLVNLTSAWAANEFDGLTVKYVDLYDVLSSREDYPDSLYDDDDRIHPRPEGHAVMAAALAAKVQEWCDGSDECDTTRACGDDSLFYPLEGDADDYEIDNSDENPYNITGFASFGGITYGGFDAEHVVECNVECDTADCFEDAVERSNGNPENVPLIVCLTADIVTTSKNEPSGDEEGSLTIDGQGHTISYGDEDCIGIRGASNIVIKNVHFKNVDAGNDKTAVKIRQNDDGDVAHHVVIQSCTFSCEGSKCDDTDAAVVVEAPSTFVSIQKCKFDGLDRAVYIRNKKDDCDGHGAGRVTISESVFLDSRRETPRVQVGWVHVYNSLWIGGGDSSDGMVLTDPENGAKPEILVEACSFDRVDDAYENDGDGTIAESAVVMDSDSRDDADTAYAPSSLSWCVPYDYDVVNASDPAAIQRLMDAAGAPAAPTAVPTAGPSPQPTAEPTPRPTDDTPAPTPAPTTPSPTSPAPTPAPTTPSPTSPAPTPAPTTAAPTVTQAPTLPVGSPAAGACLAAGGDCNSCCRGCKPKTTEDAGDVGFDFSTDPSLAAGECVCFEGALYDKTLYEKAVTLTNANDCAKVTGDYVDYGDEGNDYLYANGINNRLRGGEGDDVLNAIGTIDYMRGGAGAGDSCTYNGDRRTDDAFGFITGCEAAPTPAPVTPSPTLSCDSPEKFYPETPNENGDGYKLTSEFSQMNPYNVTGFAAWADAGIAYGGFYGGKAVTCHDADCVEHALIETDGPLIIHLGKDIDLGDARYKIMGSKDHDDKTLEGHGFTLKYSFDDDGEAPLFTDAGASNLVIRNVRFENTGDTKERPAIQIRDGAHHVVLDQCTFTCSYAGECGYAVTIEAPATFVTIQRCLFDGLEKGIHVRNKRGDNGAGRVTIVESYFRNCEKESPDAEVGWIHMASCVVEGGGCNPDNDDCDDGMIKTDPDNGGVPEILVDGGRLSVAEGKLYRKDGGGLIAAVPGVTNSSEAPDAPEDLSWCVPYDYTPIDGFDDAAVKQTKENAGAQKEFPACGVRINRGKRQDPNDFQCVTDPKKMEHDGRKIAFACCTAHICTRKDPSGQCYAGNLKKSDFAPKDWYEATKVCADEGKVLCGVEEPCSGSGCLYDHHYQWTGQECQAGDANFPYECLWPGGVKVVPGIKDVAPYCETNPDALVRDDGTDMGIAFACCNEDESSGCTRKVDGSCNAGDWRKEKGTWAPVSWADAMEHCATYGKTLCGSSNAARCQNRGCYYNNIYQWTNEPCEPPEPPPTCLVVEPITDPSACPDVCPPACKDVLVTGGQCSGDGVCAPDDQGVLCTCTPPSARRLLAEPKEEYVFDVTELGECVPCSGACEVGECVPDSRRRGLRFGMSTSGCCCGA